MRRPGSVLLKKLTGGKKTIGFRRSNVFFFMSLLFCLSWFLASCLLISGNALAGEHKGRVVMLVIDRLSVDDLKDPVLINISSLARTGSLGLLNTGTGNLRNPESTYATIGAGARAIGTKAGAFSYEASEQLPYNIKAGEEFTQRTGLVAGPENVVVLEIARLLRDNDALPYPVTPGTIGETLKQAGLKTACLGNADWRDRPGRQVATIAMDNDGLVYAGKVGRELLARDPLFPGGYRTDYDVLWRNWLVLKEKSDFIAIDLGDTARLDEARKEIKDEVFRDKWKEALGRADVFAGKLASDLDLSGRDLLIIVSPTPSSTALQDGDWFTPVVFAGRGVTPGSVITSPSTRRQGIIINTDLAPSVLEFLNVQPLATMSGRPVTFAGGGAQAQRIFDLRRQTLFVHQYRTSLIKAYLIYVLVLLVASVLLIILRERTWAERLRLHPLLLSIMCVPTACLIAPLLATYAIIPYVAGIIAITAVITFLTIIFEKRQPLAGFIFLSVVTVGSLLSDACTGNVLLSQSIFSYDPLGGARFYGIGNEYMGVVISAAILGGASILSNWPRRLTLLGIAVFWLIIIFILGAPGLGANFGGLLTSVVAFTVTLIAFTGIRFNWRVVLAVIAVLIFIPAFIGVLDLLRGQGEQSHLGRNLLLVLREPAALFDIISRKMSMNFKLFRYTIWSRILAAGIGGLLLLFYRPIGVMRVFRCRYPYLFTGFIGVVVTAVAAFLFNDSGTVAAAMATIFGIPPLLYIFLKES
ncbi:MAG: hypothetical protein AB1510_11085 [Bacillota bacterium]